MKGVYTLTVLEPAGKPKATIKLGNLTLLHPVRTESGVTVELESSGSIPLR